MCISYDKKAVNHAALSRWGMRGHENVNRTRRLIRAYWMPVIEYGNTICQVLGDGGGGRLHISMFMSHFTLPVLCEIDMNMEITTKCRV